MKHITYDRDDPTLAEGQKNTEGQHETYLALSPEERKKGFVRPVRQTYIHKGLSLCGKFEAMGTSKGYKVCSDSPDHEGKCFQSTYFHLALALAKKCRDTSRLGGCGTSTKMGTELAETYASDPKFYDATFCVSCNKHFPVNEFEWEDGTVVGS